MRLLFSNALCISSPIAPPLFLFLFLVTLLHSLLPELSACTVYFSPDDARKMVDNNVIFVALQKGPIFFFSVSCEYVRIKTMTNNNRVLFRTYTRWDMCFRLEDEGVLCVNYVNMPVLIMPSLGLFTTSALLNVCMGVFFPKHFVNKVNIPKTKIIGVICGNKVLIKKKVSQEDWGEKQSSLYALL